MELKGQHIPKATMTSYLKDKLGKTKISTEFVEGILHLSKEYITRISNRANEVCTAENKKTISLDHFYQAVEHFDLKEQMEELKKVQTEVKEEAQHKHQIKLKIQQSYEEMVKEGGIQQLKREQSAPALKQGVQTDLFKKDQEESEDYEEEVEVVEKKPSIGEMEEEGQR